MRNIVVEQLNLLPIDQRAFEIVERKGIGHPDTLIDGIMENISIALCNEYLFNFGKILHHNVDKGQICGGATDVTYGGGKFNKNIYILLSGRASADVNGKKIPITDIAINAAKDHLKKNTRFLNVDENIDMESRISEGSKDLVELFLRGPKIPFANDTSFGTGYAPLSELEQITLATEGKLNSKEYKEKHPEVGEDIKVMGLREGDKIILTVAIAFVSKFINNLDEYIKKKEEVTKDITNLVSGMTERQVIIHVNTADDYANDSVYLTLTGLSCEMGDDGSVGRGNRINGLITPCRVMSLEAASGKNPVSHVGKIYSVMAFEIAKQIIKEYPDVAECNVILLSQIGKPIDQPKNAGVHLIMKDNLPVEKVKSKVIYTVDSCLESITDITNKIVERKVTVFY
ncbi:methionine adenosyltransferase [Candidatus Micrarchaeota archaeon]|nr:methionine adenosyltransferase [Candidatus Micrarchaeota archaeon]